MVVLENLRPVDSPSSEEHLSVEFDPVSFVAAVVSTQLVLDLQRQEGLIWRATSTSNCLPLVVKAGQPYNRNDASAVLNRKHS